MSQEDVEIVRGLLAPFEQVDMAPLYRDDAIAAAFIAATADQESSPVTHTRPIRSSPRRPRTTRRRGGRARRRARRTGDPSPWCAPHA